MSAEEVPQSPKKSNRDLITQFHEVYSVALVDAETSAIHTNTEGWQNLYANHHKEERERRRKLADDLRNLADRLDVRPINDEELKELNEIKKAIVSNADGDAFFQSGTVLPIKAPVQKCEDIIRQAMVSAENQEKRAPLIDMGLVEMMRIATESVSVVRWIEDTGVVEIVRRN